MTQKSRNKSINQKRDGPWFRKAGGWMKITNTLQSIIGTEIPKHK